MKTILKLSLIPLLLPALTGQAELTVTNIAQASGANYSMFLKSDGSVWAMGFNGYGQFGDGTFNNTNRPKQILAGGVTTVVAGRNHCLLLKSDGSLWAMGYNYYGQLGDGTFTTSFPFGKSQPEQIVADGVTAIAAGYDHSLFLKSGGSLWVMGYNGDGELGDGTFSNTNQPEQIVANGVTAMAAGQSFSLFLKSDGSLWAMGDNSNGQFGDGTFNPTNRPEQIVASGVTAIAAGDSHSLFLKSDGSLWAMGYNYDGELGNGTFGSPPNYSSTWPEQIVAGGVTAIAAGRHHSLFLKSDGSLWAMGDNSSGQLGDGTFNKTNQPEKIVASGVTAIAAGDSHSLFLKSDGSLWVMGDNSYRQLGDGFIDNNDPYGTATPEQIFPVPQPALSSVPSSQTNLQFAATCGFGGNFYLLGSPDLALPLSQWTPLGTNSVTTRGTNNYSVTLTNAFNPGGQQFYILQSR